MTPQRSPTTPGKGTIGTFYVGYKIYFTYQYAYFSTPSIPTGWPYPVNPQWVTLDNETTAQAAHYENFGSIYENADIASGFKSTMEAGRYSGTSNPNITAADVTGGIFNSANVGLLCVHASAGNTAESDGAKRSYLRFWNPTTQSSSYCKLDACSFGGSDTNGLKWMAILACPVLTNNDYNSLYSLGRLPINNDLHLLLSTATTASAAPTLGTDWAGYMEQSWFKAGQDAYAAGETNHVVITFRVAGWPDAFADTLSDVNTSPGTGDQSDIIKADQTVFNNP